MKLAKPTHILESNKAKMRMSEYTEEIPAQIAAGVNRLGSRGFEYYSIYPVPPDVAYDEFPHSEEWIQTTGVAPDRLTVEIKKRDAKGVHRLYTVGRSAAAAGSVPTEPIQNGDNTYLVLSSEVLTAAEAVELFQSYYDTHELPSAWHLREQTEFSDTAVAAAQQDTGSAAGGVSSTGRAPVTKESAEADAPGAPTAKRKDER